MAKQTGLGNVFLVEGYDLSTDTNTVDNLGYTQELLDTTGIDQTCFSRILGRTDSTLTVNGWFDNGTNKSHDAYLSSNKLPTADRVITYLFGTTRGDAALLMNGKQSSYDTTMSPGNALATSATFSANAITNFDGMNFGVLLDAGVTAYSNGTTNGTSVDQSASSSAGAVATLQFTTGSTLTSADFKVQHSANDSTWADLITFTQITSTTASAEVGTATGTVNRYIRLVATINGTSATAQISFARL